MPRQYVEQATSHGFFCVCVFTAKVWHNAKLHPLCSMQALVQLSAPSHAVTMYAVLHQLVVSAVCPSQLFPIDSVRLHCPHVLTCIASLPGF